MKESLEKMICYEKKFPLLIKIRMMTAERSRKEVKKGSKKIFPSDRLSFSISRHSIDNDGCLDRP
jgi:hypothetical protein